MWIAKLKIAHNSRIANRTKEHSVLCYSILLGRFTKNNVPYVSGLHYIVGKEEKITNFIKDLRKDNGVKKIEIKGNVFSMLEKAENIPSSHLEPSIFFVKPVLSSDDGFEYWEIANWKRFNLVKFIKKLEKEKINVEMLKITESKLDEVYFPKIMPKLTKNQKKAIELAIIKGYYKYPRKINLETLSKESNISVSTFQEHIRKAENKIIPLFSDFE